MTNLGYLIWKKIPYELLSGESGSAELKESFKSEVRENIAELKARRVTRIRTGVSWLEWETPGGRELIEWYIRECHEAGLDILPNLTYTPISKGILPKTNSAPQSFISFAEFVNDVCISLKSYVSQLEFWNEPNLNTDWDSATDREYVAFARLIMSGALVAHFHGMKVVLGGISGIDEKGLDCFRVLVRHGVMYFADVIGFHNLRGSWSDKIPPLPLKLQSEILAHEAGRIPDMALFLQHLAAVRREAAQNGEEMAAMVNSELANMSLLAGAETEKPVWLTEYGFSTYDSEKKYLPEYLEEIQAALFAYALKHTEKGEPERVYWYTYKDRISPTVRFITTGMEDEIQYFYGDTDLRGEPKLLGRLLKERGPERVMEYVEKGNLWHLVDKASIDRKLPDNYISQSKVA